MAVPELQEGPNADARAALACVRSSSPTPEAEMLARRCRIISQHSVSWGVEYFFVCPYCSERISMVLDISVRRQTYIEDCEVCCRPIEITYAVKDDEVRQFEARAV